MIITRKKNVPLSWAFYAQIPLLLSIYGGFLVNAPFLLLIKRFIDNPAAIMGLISIEVYLTLIGGPFMSWLSDRIWTKYGRRKPFIVFADCSKGFILIMMPFAPNLWTLILLRWLFGVLGDLGHPSQAMAYEIVPPPQRGRSSGFFNVMINIMNIVFFLLVIGRFDDVYFMGPFAAFNSLSGGVIMFFLGSLLLLGVSAFEGMAIREVYPPNRRRLHDGRRSGENVVKFFVRSVFRDVFTIKLLPLYLLLFVGAMFGVGLGIFEPLLYKEQWGYTLQEMGTNVAIGAFMGIFLALFAGWLADKTSKMKIYVLGLVGGALVKIAWVIFVYFKPDKRPELWEIVLFGNIGFVFSLVAGTVSYPLLMEFVERNRMGAASAGIGLFNGIIRNGLGLFVGFWLFLWSITFLPQAGYRVETVFQGIKQEENVRELLESKGISLQKMALTPLHQPGIDGHTSMRWLLHENNEAVRELMKEKKDLENQIINWDNKADSPWTSEEKRQELEQQITEARERIEQINVSLEQGAAELRERILPALASDLYAAGEQLREARLQDGVLTLRVTTIEAPLEEDLEKLTQTLQGGEHRLIPNDDEDAISRFKADIEVQALEGEPPGLLVKMAYDPRFLTLYSNAVEAGWDSDLAYDVSVPMISIIRSILGREAEAFDIEQARFEPVDEQTADAEMGQTMTLVLRGDEDIVERDREDIRAALEQEPNLTAVEAGGGGRELTLTLRLNPEEEDEDAAAETEGTAPTADELMEGGIRERLGEFFPEDRVARSLTRQSYGKLIETAAAPPMFLTIPRPVLDVGHEERKYEYFFSIYSLMIASDIFGLLVVVLILKLEKKGIVHRYGIEEDEKR